MSTSFIYDVAIPDRRADLGYIAGSLFSVITTVPVELDGRVVCDPPVCDALPNPDAGKGRPNTFDCALVVSNALPDG